MLALIAVALSASVQASAANMVDLTRLKCVGLGLEHFGLDGKKKLHPDASFTNEVASNGYGREYAAGGPLVSQAFLNETGDAAVIVRAIGNDRSRDPQDTAEHVLILLGVSQPTPGFPGAVSSVVIEGLSSPAATGTIRCRQQ